MRISGNLSWHLRKIMIQRSWGPLKSISIRMAREPLFHRCGKWPTHQKIVDHPIIFSQLMLPILPVFCPSVCPVCQFISAYYPIPGSHSWFPRPPMPTRKLDMGRHRSPQGMQCNSLYRQFVTVESNKTIRPYESHKLGTYASASGFLKGIVDPNCFCGPSFEGWKIDNDIPFTSNNSLRSAVQLQCSTYKHPDKSNQQTRMQSRKTLLWNKLFQQSCTFFPCHRTSVDCGVWGVKTLECWVGNVMCRVRTGDCGV